MALFSRNKKEDKKAEAPAASASVASTQGVGHSHFLKSPRITEKATMHSALGVYVFDIDESATKRDVLLAVRRLYAVTPKMVRVVNVPRKVKRNMRTGRTGITGGGRKAYVYLKKGDQITLT